MSNVPKASDVTADMFRRWLLQGSDRNDKTFGPQSGVSSFPGAENDGNFIMVTFTWWANQWLWSVFWYSTQDNAYWRLWNENGGILQVEEKLGETK